MADSKKRSTDPRAKRSRALIIPTAIRHFVANGYTSANLDDIAAEAGVSKRTIYNLYQTKEQLFRAALGNAFATAERYATDIIGALSADDLENGLHHAASELSKIVTSGQILGLRRLTIGEAARFPDLAAEYWRRAPGTTLDALTERFTKLGEQGVLAIDNAELAAQHFAYLTIGAAIDHALFHPETRSESTDLEATARAGVDAFLRAYRP